MRKIKIDTTILTIKGEPLMNDFVNERRTEEILHDIKNFVITTDDNLRIMFDKWQKEIKKTERREMTIRDYLLGLLGARFDFIEVKECFWTTQLGLLISDDENKEIEISENKYQFLKRIVEKNKIKRTSATGQEIEIELYYPFELGQLLIALDEDLAKEEPIEKPKSHLEELKDLKEKDKHKKE
jgi:hypothetical protein